MYTFNHFNTVNGFEKKSVNSFENNLEVRCIKEKLETICFVQL